MEIVYCVDCERKINTLILLGEPHTRFKDGVRCGKCAEIKVQKMREKLNG